ncbi:unnamed protein product [Lampetra fluviatilis]
MDHVLVAPIVSLEGRSCQQHGSPYRFFCKQDESLVCKDCTIAGDHIGHRVITLKDEHETQKKTTKRINVLAHFYDDDSDADVIPTSEQEIAAPPVDPDDQLPSAQEGEPGEAGAPGPAQEWRAIIAQWEAKLAALTAETSQPQPAPAMPVVAENAATAPAAPQAAPDVAGAPASLLPGSKHRLPRVQPFKARVGDWTAFTRHF